MSPSSHHKTHHANPSAPASKLTAFASILRATMRMGRAPKNVQPETQVVSSERLDKYIMQLRMQIEEAEGNLKFAMQCYKLAHKLNHRAQAQKFLLWKFRPVLTTQSYGRKEQYIARLSEKIARLMGTTRTVVISQRKCLKCFNYAITELRSLEGQDEVKVVSRYVELLQWFLKEDFFPPPAEAQEMSAA